MSAPFSLLASFRKGLTRRSAVRTLRNLSPAQLRDIGIPSDSLDDVVGEMLALTAARNSASASAGLGVGVRRPGPAGTALRFG